MQSKGDFKPYYEATLGLATLPHFQHCRTIQEEAPKAFSTGKLLANYLLQGLSELKDAASASALVLAQTQPEDDLLIKRLWTLDSIVKIYPYSYNLFIDQLFKNPVDHQIMSYISQHQVFEDPYWPRIERELVTNLEAFISDASSQTKKDSWVGFAPALIEEQVGKMRILNQHEWLFKSWSKTVHNQIRKKKKSESLRPSPGWSCGVLAFERQLTQPKVQCSFARYELAEEDNGATFLGNVCELVGQRLQQLGLAQGVIDELIISAASLPASKWIADRCGDGKKTTVLLLDQIFGWNPVASFLRALATRQRLAVGILIERAPFVDIVVVHHER